MRAIVYLLALFAALKVGSQQYLFRASARDAIVAAYRERAIEACRSDPRSAAAGLSAAAWARPSEIRLAIGKSDIDVHLWQIDHQLWDARYRNPYLLIAPAGAGSIVCEYDVVRHAALILRG